MHFKAQAYLSLPRLSFTKQGRLAEVDFCAYQGRQKYPVDGAISSFVLCQLRGQTMLGV